MAISSKASEVASARGAMLTPAGRGAASWSCPSCAESQLAPRRVIRAAPKAANMRFMESPLPRTGIRIVRTWLHRTAHGDRRESSGEGFRRLGKRFGRNAPRRRSIEVLKSGVEHGSAARAAPQQVIPAAPPQQWPPQSVNTPTATGPEARAVLGAVTFATGTAAFLTAPVSDNGGTTFAARSG